MGRLKLLDLFCGAGGAGMGYHRAGFDVFGVDNDPKPLRHYPFPHACNDALAYLTEHGHEYDAIHASPPCQNDSRMRKLTIALGHAKSYPALIVPVRERLIRTGKPYVLENVPGAPLIDPIILCGSSFGLKVQRHRLFESNISMLQPPCAHYWQGKEALPPLHRLQGHSRVVGCYGNGRAKGDNKALWQEAMGITWMIRAEIREAIPPAYTEYIGTHLLHAIAQRQHPDMTEERHDQS